MYNEEDSTYNLSQTSSQFRLGHYTLQYLFKSLHEESSEDSSLILESIGVFLLTPEEAKRVMYSHIDCGE